MDMIYYDAQSAYCSRYCIASSSVSRLHGGDHHTLVPIMLIINMAGGPAAPSGSDWCHWWGQLPACESCCCLWTMSPVDMLCSCRIPAGTSPYRLCWCPHIALTVRRGEQYSASLPYGCTHTKLSTFLCFAVPTLMGYPAGWMPLLTYALPESLYMQFLCPVLLL